MPSLTQLLASPNPVPAARIPESESQPDPLTALLARLPQSITNPNYKLPQFSNRIADFAPLYKLDLIPNVQSVPMLPLPTENLQTHFETKCTNLSNAIINLRADIMYNPDPDQKKPPRPSRRNPPKILISDKPYDFNQTPESKVEAALARLASFYEFPAQSGDPPPDP